MNKDYELVDFAVFPDFTLLALQEHFRQEYKKHGPRNDLVERLEAIDYELSKRKYPTCKDYDDIKALLESNETFLKRNIED